MFLPKLYLRTEDNLREKKTTVSIKSIHYLEDSLFREKIMITDKYKKKYLPPEICTCILKFTMVRTCEVIF